MLMKLKKHVILVPSAISLQIESSYIKRPNFEKNKQIRCDTNYSSKKPDVTCIFCVGNSDHHTSACTKFTTAERVALLRSVVHCLRCLSRNHRSPECTSHRKCTVCAASHHYTICPQRTSLLQHHHHLLYNILLFIAFQRLAMSKTKV